MATIVGQNKNKKVIEKAISLDYPVLLIGETGTGKTSVIREMAKKRKQKLYRVNLNGQTSIDEFVGHWLIKDGETFWQDGVLIKAMKEGAWIVLDEINACLPEITFVLHSLLDDDHSVMLTEKDSEVVKPAKGFRLFATMNPSDEYAGTKELNKAFISRFPIILEFNYLDLKAETKLVEKVCKVSHETASKITQFAHLVRDMKKKDDIDYTFSTRDLIYWGEFVEEFGLAESFEMCILHRAVNGDKDILKEKFVEFFGMLDAFKKETGSYDLLETMEKIKQEFNKDKERKEMLNEMYEELKKQEEFIRKELEKAIKQANKEANSSQSNSKEKKENKKKEKKERNAGKSEIKIQVNMPKIDFKSVEQFIQGKAEAGAGNEMTEEETDDAQDAVSSDNCNHKCDGCPSRAKCEKDVKGVK